MRIVTLGLGGGAGSLISQGLISEAVRIIRGGRSAASRAYKDLQEIFKISAMLVQANGKELVEPIFNNIRKVFLSESSFLVRVTPKKLKIRKSDNIKVEVKNVKVRNKNVRN